MKHWQIWEKVALWHGQAYLQLHAKFAMFILVEQEAGSHDHYRTCHFVDRGLAVLKIADALDMHRDVLTERYHRLPILFLPILFLLTTSRTSIDSCWVMAYSPTVHYAHGHATCQPKIALAHLVY